MPLKPGWDSLLILDLLPMKQTFNMFLFFSINNTQLSAQSSKHSMDDKASNSTFMKIKSSAWDCAA